MSRRRRPKLVQRIPPPAAFEAVERREGENYWLVTIVDDTDAHDRPCFEHRVARSKKARRFTVDEVARAAAGELNEARGLVFLSEHRDGVPVASFVFASDGRHVFCIRTSDPERVEAVDLAGLPARAAQALAEAAAERAQVRGRAADTSGEG